jgi:RND family efflux transporter MFP subunit
MSDNAPILNYAPPSWLKAVGVIALCVAAVVTAFGLFGRARANQNIAKWTDGQAIPIVNTIYPSDAGHNTALVLPGNIQAFYTAPVYARVTGYLKTWYTDIGTTVKAGQTLADIETPDLDQQVVAARGGLDVAIANQNLAAITAKRYEALFAQNAIAAMVRDQAVGALDADIAATKAARGNLGQLVAEETFKKIVAPFDGIVTSRSTDVGALITVGTPGNVPLFTVSDISRLRIYVNVPQNDSALVQPGMTAKFTVPQYPGRTFTAMLATTAESVNATNGTLLAEFHIDNSDFALKPGDYAKIEFVVPSRSNVLLVPASALMFRDGGMFVATVGSDGRIGMKPITIGRDLGSSVEVSAGLSRDDRVVESPPDFIGQGSLVHIAGGNPPKRQLTQSPRKLPSITTRMEL